MTEMTPEALVPDVWRCEPAPCPECGGPWDAMPHGTCDQGSCRAPTVIIPEQRLPLLWWNDDPEPDCG